MFTALAQIYAVITFIMKMLNIWEGYLDWLEAEKVAIRSERAIARENAIRAGVEAKTDEDIWKAQEDVVKNLPRP